VRPTLSRSCPFSAWMFENVNCETRFFIQSYQAPPSDSKMCGRRHFRAAGDKMDPCIFYQAPPRPGCLMSLRLLPLFTHTPILGTSLCLEGSSTLQGRGMLQPGTWWYTGYGPHGFGKLAVELFEETSIVPVLTPWRHF
jgi:hypothetical protein